MPRLLDLFCCQGGASRGYADAGFEVVGVDIDPQPRYPFEFIQADATSINPEWIAANFDAVHASPPCQAHSRAWKINKREHPRLIEPTRELLVAAGRPYIIENVEDARDELLSPFTLCGAMFGLHTYRHRLFETTFRVEVPEHAAHDVRTAKMGRPAADDEYMHIVGNFSGVERARHIMGMPWANRDGLREAIPTAYAEFIGRQLLDALVLQSIDLCPACDFDPMAPHNGKGVCPSIRPSVHERAVAIFERRMGFAFTDDYEQSREWSDAMAEAHESTDQWVTAPDGEEFLAGACQGHPACPVDRHEHGCFADDGTNCDHPEDHESTDGEP